MGVIRGAGQSEFITTRDSNFEVMPDSSSPCSKLVVTLFSTNVPLVSAFIGYSVVLDDILRADPETIGQQNGKQHLLLKQVGCLLFSGLQLRLSVNTALPRNISSSSSIGPSSSKRLMG